MKKRSVLPVLVFLTSMTGGMAAPAETARYKQAPMREALVESGELPPVEQRLPPQGVSASQT